MATEAQSALSSLSKLRDVCTRTFFHRGGRRVNIYFFFLVLYLQRLMGGGDYFQGRGEVKTKLTELSIVISVFFF